MSQARRTRHFCRRNSEVRGGDSREMPCSPCLAHKAPVMQANNFRLDRCEHSNQSHNISLHQVSFCTDWGPLSKGDFENSYAWSTVLGILTKP